MDTRYRYTSWRESLLIGSLLLTTATQLRLDGFPIGLGEAGLLLWLILFIYVLSVRPLPVNRLVVWYGLFWLVSLPSLILGTVIAQQLGEAAPLAKYIREMLALFFVAALSLVLAIETGSREASLGRVSRLIRYGAAFSVIVALFAWFGEDITPIKWWLGHRLQGLAENPNQLALLLLPMPFFTAYRLSVVGFRFTYLFAGIILVLAGLATRSDALILGWAAAIGFYIAYILQKRLSMLLQVPSWLLFLVAGVLGGLVIVWSVDSRGLHGVLAGIYGTDSEQYQQSFRRFDLWINGIIAGMDSPFFGLGPGNHSGFEGPNQDSEAHNSLIDWFTISGLVGLSAFLLLVIAQFRRALYSNVWLACIMVAILVFASFHYMFRHPLFWFYLVLVGQLSMYRASSRTDVSYVDPPVYLQGEEVSAG